MVPELELLELLLLELLLLELWELLELLLLELLALAELLLPTLLELELLELLLPGLLELLELLELLALEPAELVEVAADCPLLSPLLPPHAEIATARAAASSPLRRVEKNMMSQCSSRATAFNVFARKVQATCHF